MYTVLRENETDRQRRTDRDRQTETDRQRSNTFSSQSPVDNSLHDLNKLLSTPSNGESSKTKHGNSLTACFKTYDLWVCQTEMKFLAL